VVKKRRGGGLDKRGVGQKNRIKKDKGNVIFTAILLHDKKIISFLLPYHIPAMCRVAQSLLLIGTWLVSPCADATCSILANATTTAATAAGAPRRVHSMDLVIFFVVSFLDEK
jgi:hypothetical protein